MKNVLKFGFLAIALALTVAACNSEKTADGTDTSAIDTSMMATDTTMTDTMAVDTTMNKM